MPLPERDPRVYFAAERTFLAWIRTGLALMGFGFVVARFGLFMREIAAVADKPHTTSGISVWVGTAFVLLGSVVTAGSAFQYRRTIHRLNAGDDVTGRPSRIGLILAAMMALAGAGMAVYLITER